MATEAIAQLLVGPRSAETAERLMNWTAEQTLENRVVMGILPFVKASHLNSELSFPVRLIDSAIRRPSLLSNLILKEIGLPGEAVTNLRESHSGSAPPGFKPSDFFWNNVRVLTSPMHAIHSERIEEQFSLPFTRQWGFEWERLVQAEGVALSTYFDYRGRRHEPHLPIMEARLSDVYLSAFLRALTWAVTTSQLEAAVAEDIAADACPVNLDFWRVENCAKPLWWPSIVASGQSIDTAPAQVWQQVAELWSEKGRLNDNVLLAANGWVGESNSQVYGLEIIGLIERAVGPEDGSVESILNDCDRLMVEWFAPPLRFDGDIVPRPLESYAITSGDWRCLSLSGFAFPLVGGRWDYLHMWRGFRLPSPIIGKERLTVRCASSAVEILEGQAVLGRVETWTDGAGERLLANSPPRSGYVVTADVGRIEELTQVLSASFVWACRLTSFLRSQSYEEFKVVPSFQSYGMSRVVRY